MTTQPFTLMVVEDDDLEALNVERAVRDHEGIAQVVRARDGVEALELLRGDELGTSRVLVLLDLHMPRMSGLDVLEAIRADDRLRGLPVVVMTTSDSESDVREAFDYNVAGYFLKPATRDDFLACVQGLAAYWTRVVFP